MTVKSKKELINNLRANYIKNCKFNQLLQNSFEMVLKTKSTSFGTKIDYLENDPEKINEMVKQSKTSVTTKDVKLNDLKCIQANKSEKRQYFKNTAVSQTFENVIDNIENEYRESIMRLPNFGISSNIITFKQYCDLWICFPSYV